MLKYFVIIWQIDLAQYGPCTGFHCHQPYGCLGYLYDDIALEYIAELS